MTTPAEIAISLGVLTLVAGGSLVYWVVLFLRSGGESEKEDPSVGGSSSPI